MTEGTREDGRRWYDEWKVKVSLMTGVIGLAVLVITGTAFAVTWVATVGATPSGLDAHSQATAKWQEEHLDEHATISHRLDVLTEIVWCASRYEGGDAMDRCLSDGTRRVLEAQLPRR